MEAITFMVGSMNFHDIHRVEAKAVIYKHIIGNTSTHLYDHYERCNQLIMLTMPQKRLPFLDIKHEAVGPRSVKKEHKPHPSTSHLNAEFAEGATRSLVTSRMYSSTLPLSADR